MNEKKIDLSVSCIRAREPLSQERIDDALGLYGDVIQVDPNNALAHADRGTAYAMLKEIDMALTDLEWGLALGYVDTLAYSSMATICFELKRFSDALRYFAKAVELDPNHRLIYYNRSNILHALGDNKAAIEDLEKCLGFNSGENFNEKGTDPEGSPQIYSKPCTC
ncbi:tetratricopeptide repeat protein [Pseudomonas gingeri]|uniref:tetratricopeptide repeat protein n=1 Tax=Pseudomonas gingeri TaxID=117681 RepID=UPI00159F787E|nr:tetratricopeptide repeat protein [Pseudomonas gingeri]NWD72289.1 tetratricopeptide repeat protein [Pseudomonas gingeri]